MPPSHKVFYKNKSHFADSFSRKTYFEIMPFLWIRIEDHVKKRNPINDKYSLQYHTNQTTKQIFTRKHSCKS